MFAGGHQESTLTVCKAAVCKQFSKDLKILRLEMPRVLAHLSEVGERAPLPVHMELEFDPPDSPFEDREFLGVYLRACFFKLTCNVVRGVGFLRGTCQAYPDINGQLVQVCFDSFRCDGHDA